MIQSILIDDEPKATRLLQLLIEEVDKEFHVQRAFNKPQEALDFIKQNSVDVIFLDIEMPEMNGFEFVKRLGSINSLIVFVTGYDHYAIKALRLSAVGYILKPIDTEELTQVLNIVKKRIELQSHELQNKVLLENIALHNVSQKKIGIPSVDGIDFVKIDDIICCEGVEKYTKVRLINGKELLSSYNIGEFYKLISDLGFFQVHRSFIVNIQKVQQYQKEGLLIMDDGSNVPLARRRKEDFLQVMTTIHR